MQRCISNRKKQKTKNYSIAVNNEEHSLTITGKDVDINSIYPEACEEHFQPINTSQNKSITKIIVDTENEDNNKKAKELASKLNKVNTHNWEANGNTLTKTVYLNYASNEDVKAGATICARLDTSNGDYAVNNIVEIQGKASMDEGVGWKHFKQACKQAATIGVKQLKVLLTNGYGTAAIDKNDPDNKSVFTNLHINNTDVSYKLKDCYIVTNTDTNTTTVTFGAKCENISSFSTNNCTIPEDTKTITVKKWNKNGNAENDKKLAASLANRLNIWDEKNKYIWKDNNDGTLTKVSGLTLTKNKAEYTLTLEEKQTVDKAKLTDELFKDATKITVKVTEDDDEANTKTKEQAAALQKQLGKNWKVEDDGITLTNVKTQTTDDEVALLNLYDTIY